MYLCHTRIYLFHRVTFTIRRILIFLITALSRRVDHDINVNPIVTSRDWPLRRRRISPPRFLLDLLILHRFLRARPRTFIDRGIIFALDDVSRRQCLYVVRDFSRIASIPYRFIVLQIIFDRCPRLRIFIIHAIIAYLFHRLARRIIFLALILDRLLQKILFLFDRGAIFLRAPSRLRCRSDRVEEGSVSAAMETRAFLPSRWEILDRWQWRKPMIRTVGRLFFLNGNVVDVRILRRLLKNKLKLIVTKLKYVMHLIQYLVYLLLFNDFFLFLHHLIIIIQRNLDPVVYSRRRRGSSGLTRYLRVASLL